MGLFVLLSDYEGDGGIHVRRGIPNGREGFIFRQDGGGLRCGNWHMPQLRRLLPPPRPQDVSGPHTERQTTTTRLRPQDGLLLQIINLYFLRRRVDDPVLFPRHLLNGVGPGHDFFTFQDAFLFTEPRRGADELDRPVVSIEGDATGAVAHAQVLLVKGTSGDGRGWNRDGEATRPAAFE